MSRTPHVSDPTAPWALYEMGGRVGRLSAGGVDPSTDQWIVAGQHLIGAQYRHLFAY